MAFGFPAYHEAKFSQPQFGGDLLGLAGQVMIKLGWTPLSGTPDSVTASTKRGLSTYGDFVTVRISPTKELTLKSESYSPLNCFDWGRNKKHVMKLLNALQQETQTAYWQKPQ